MTYSTLMVHLELDHSNDARLQLAGDLAEQFDATLIGVAACDPQLPYYPLGALAADVLELEEIEVKERISEAERRFRAAVQGRARTVEWRSALIAPTSFVASQARAADLIIIGANRDSGPSDPLHRLDSSDFVMQAGRPVFIVPTEVERLRLNRVLVAWKDTREARRAVFDALPLLQKSKEVDVLEVVTGEDSVSEAQQRVGDVAAWLASHRVPALARAMHAVDQADQIEKIWRTDSDLVVAGAYGHTRFREWALGGFTRRLLSHSHRCALVAH